MVPRIISASTASKSVHGLEVRFKIPGAEVSIVVSVVGVWCVAMAAKSWMILTGESSIHTGTA